MIDCLTREGFFRAIGGGLLAATSIACAEKNDPSYQQQLDTALGFAAIEAEYGFSKACCSATCTFRRVSAPLYIDCPQKRRNSLISSSWKSVVTAFDFNPQHSLEAIWRDSQLTMVKLDNNPLPNDPQAVKRLTEQIKQGG